MRVLERHAVHYVLIGGLAAEAHGSQRATFDIDIVPERAEDNLEHLADALRELDGQVIHNVVREAGAVEVHIERPVWSVEIFGNNPFLHVRTVAGDIDVLLAPDGLPGGYSQLLPGSIIIRPHNIAIRLAALEDLIKSKRASNRAKDHISLPELEALLEVSPYDPGSLG